MTTENDMQEVTQKPWADVIAPIAAKFSTAWLSNGEAIWNAEGSEAMAKLLTRMAEHLDNGDGYFVPRAELAASAARVQALEGEVARLREALEKSASELDKAEAWFSHYSTTHLSKATAEGNQKAAVNLARSMDMGEAAFEARAALTERPND
jgi:hypothetical protein